MDVKKRKEIIEMIKQLSYFFDKCKNKLCEPYGLSSIQSKVIIDVFHNEGTKITGICQRLNKETNTISPLVNRLIKHDYLIKKNDEEDKRVFYVYLTEKSRQIMSSLEIDIEKTTWPMFDSVSLDKLEMIYDSLKILMEVTQSQCDI